MKGFYFPGSELHYPETTVYVFTSVLCVVVLIRTTPYAVYSPETYEGHWRQLTVRTSRLKQTMAMVFFNPQVMRSLVISACLL